MNIDQLRGQIDLHLSNLVDKYCVELIEIDPQLTPVADALKDYLVEGKRFRSIFALIGYLGAGGELKPEIYRACAALEFLQASALIHDDLMDGSDTRRGKPAIHKQFEKLHNSKFGSSAAILIGDLALTWNERALHESGLTASAQTAVNPIHDVMRTELMAGQFLDVLEQTKSGSKSFSIERSLKIARYKSGKYSIERPLHFGAALALASNSEKLPEYLAIFSEYGLPLGEAFQLRDDLLGIYGDPVKTGKPAGDDLREGKRTALIAYAHDRGSQEVKALLEKKLGTDLDQNEIEELRAAIIETGAVKHVEEVITKLSKEALASIQRDELTSESKQLLREMVDQVVNRTR